MAPKKVMKTKGMFKRGKTTFVLPHFPKKKPAAAKEAMNIDSLTSFMDIVKEGNWSETEAQEHDPMDAEWSEAEEEAEQEVKEVIKRPAANVLNVGWVDGWMSYMRPSIKAIFWSKSFFCFPKLGLRASSPWKT